MLSVLNGCQRAALEEATRLFNTGDYFTCHEVLEEAWREAEEPARTFLKGLIHAAVALYQYQRGNSHGARVKSASARRYLEPYLPSCERLDLQTLLADLERFIAPLYDRPPGAPPPRPRQPWPRLRDAGGERFDS